MRMSIQTLFHRINRFTLTPPYWRVSIATRALLRMGKGHVLRLSPLIIFGFSLVAWACSEWKGEIWLINKGSKPIIRGNVEVCAQTIIFEGLDPGESQHSSFFVRGECSYTIEVVFSDKSTLVKELGYVTSGFNYIDYVIVKDKELLLNPEGYERQVLSH